MQDWQKWQTPEYLAAMQAEYGRIRAKHPTLVTVGFECFSGWFGIIDKYFDDIARLLAAHPGSTYDLHQVKEKFAGLRLYAHSSCDISAAVTAGYDKASAEVDKTCEVCGQPGALRVRDHWYMTRCEEHADGGTPTKWEITGGGL